MNRCFKKDNQVEYHELSERTKKAMDAVFTAEQIEELSVRGVRSFNARFIVAGPVGYQEQNDITYISPEVLYRVAPTLINRAVIASPHDLNITAENIMQKAKGRVVDVWKESDADAWWARFEIWDEDLLKAIDDGKFGYVSCAYFITEDGGAYRYNGIDCTTNMLDGFMHHLCITDSPRFNDSDIWRVNEYKNMLNVFRIGDIIKFNEDEPKKEKEHKMSLKKLLGFKTNEIEINDDVKFPTDAGLMSISQMIAKINEDQTTIKSLQDEVAAKVEKEPETNAGENDENAQKPETDDGKKHEPSAIFAEAKAAEKIDNKAVQDAVPKDNGESDNVKVNEDGTVQQTVKIRGTIVK